MEFDDEELNYFRLSKIVTQIIPEGLREIFKQQWDLLYSSIHGKWMDTPANYASFKSMESSTKKNKHYLLNMASGDRKRWDSTCLSNAILFSNSIGRNLLPNVKKSVDILRESRNEIVHNAKGRLNNVDFQALVQKILLEFITLKLDTTELLQLKNQTSFPTGELNIIKKEVEDEKKRNAQPIPFCVLPPKSFHDQVIRKKEVHDILKKMRELSNERKGETTTVYLSGNPGCGKSVLAGQIGDEYFDSNDTEQPAFVMTINASSLDTLLQSYIDFAEKLNCYPDSITEITTSKYLTQENQILQLKALVAKQIDKFASWLMIIDNVIDQKSMAKYWPQFGEKTCGIGQILITTQDEHAIADNSYTRNISLKRGMTEEDAIEVLSKVSGIMHDDEMKLNVAKTLDLQPLALACAGVYMRKARTVTTWRQYLEKLEQGQRQATEKMFEKSSVNYPMPMTVAVRMALKRETNESEVMSHAFDFLSALANDPVPTEYVVRYVVQFLPSHDEEVLASIITSSSLVVLSDNGDELTMHQVVYHCLQEKDLVKSGEVDMFAVISAFSGLLQSFDNTLTDIIKTRTLLNHFDYFSKELSSYVTSSIFHEKCHTFLIEHFGSLLNNLGTIGRICIMHGKFQSAKVFFQVCLSMKLSSFIDEMENVFVGTEFLNDNGSKTQIDLIMKEARSVYGEKENYINYPKATYDEFGKKTLVETLSGFGIALSNLGKLSLARGCYKVALEICKLEYQYNYAWLKLQAQVLDLLADISKEMRNAKESAQYREQSILLHKEIKKMVDSLKENKCTDNKALDLNGLVYIEASAYYGLGKSKYINASSHVNSYNDEYLKEATAHFEKALSRYYSVNKEEKHPKIANTLNRLGRCAFRLRKYCQAKLYHEDALLIYESVYDENHPLVGSTLNKLGKTCLTLEFYEEAVAYFEKSLVIYKRLLRENHRTMGKLQINLAYSLRMQGLFFKAKIYYINALAIFKNVYGENHPMAVRILLDLAQVHCGLSEFVEARICYENCLAKGNMKDFPHIAESLSALGDAFYDQKNYSEARICYEKAIATGCRKRNIGALLFTLGDYLLKDQQFIDAKQCYINGLATGYGIGINSVGESLFNLGRCFILQARLTEPKTCVERVLLTGYTSENSSVGRPTFGLGSDLHFQRNLNDAKICYLSALSTGYGRGCPSVGEEIFNLGAKLDGLGKSIAAKTCYIAALTTGYGKDTPSVGESVFKLGKRLYEMGELYEAKTLFIETLKTGYSEEYPSVGAEMFRLTLELYDGNLQEARISCEYVLTTGYAKDCPSVRKAILKFITTVDDLEHFIREKKKTIQEPIIKTI